MEELAASTCLLRVFIYRRMRPVVTLGFAVYNAASDFYKVFAMTVEKKSTNEQHAEELAEASFTIAVADVPPAAVNQRAVEQA